MQLIPLASPSQQAACWTSSRTIESVSGLIACVGAPDFDNDALGQINRLLPVSWWTVFRIYDDLPPSMPVAGSFGVRDDTHEPWRAYRHSLYQRDQTFIEAREQTSATQQTLVHWHALELPRLHRERIYRRYDLRERVSLVCRDDDGLVAVNFYRHDTLPCFTDDDLDMLSGASPLILSCVRRHLSLRRESGPSSLALDGLTPREREVCTRLLKGWTHEGIAADLGISAGTVKTYRDRAFEKLGIHHRNELFALAAGTLS